MEIKLIKTYYENNGLLDLDNSLNLSGKLAGICYNKDSFEKIENEPVEKTNKRINLTINNGHHSVYDHIYMTLLIIDAPKILAMILNNEKMYTTSEKSARYTKIDKNNGISDKEISLYNKWHDIFYDEIKKKYGNTFSDIKIKKLAQENARYMVSVFMNTTFAYTVSLRQINYIVSWMNNYIKSSDRLSNSMKEFIFKLKDLNILDERLQSNDKNRSLSIFNDHIDENNFYFGDVYSCTYKASLAYFAQAERHRTLNYQMNMNKTIGYFIPPILNDELSKEWIDDISLVDEFIPQGKNVLIKERGTYEDFKLKLKERLCSNAQLEINDKTKEILDLYYTYLVVNNNPLKDDLKKYMNGARCTFPDYECSSRCNFNEGITLKRKI